MSIYQLFEFIESPLFHAEIGVVSTPRAFDDALLKQESVRLLISEINTGESYEMLGDRIGLLLNDPKNDPQFSHPQDLPIAVYLRVLDILSSSLSLPSAELVVNHGNLWWARAMALRILSEPRSQSATQYEKIESDVFGVAYMLPSARGWFMWEDAKHAIENVLNIQFAIVSYSAFVSKPVSSFAQEFKKRVRNLT